MSAWLCLAYIFLLCIGPIYCHRVLSNIQQLTFGGINARPRFSDDGSSILFQGSGEMYGTSCSQAYRLDLGARISSPLRGWERIYRLSSGIGVADAPFPLPNTDGDQIISSDFHEVLSDLATVNSSNAPTQCPAWRSSIARKVRMRLNGKTDLFRLNKWGNFRQQLTYGGNYDGDASVSSDGRLVVFTSNRTGTPNLWIMNAEDGSGVRQLTNRTGYKGGADFSPDGRKVVFHATVPAPKSQEKEDERAEKGRIKLKSNEIRSELFIVNTDGNGLRQLTHLGASSWDPTYTRDGSNKIIFTSSYNSSRGNGADGGDLYLIDEDGGSLRRVTSGLTSGWIDTFPSFDSRGRRLVWARTRTSTHSNELNMDLFMANWSSVMRKEKNRTIVKHRQHLAARKRQRSRSRPAKRRAIHFKGEKHLTDIRQLTFGGQNAEGYFAFDDSSIVMQAAGLERYGTTCDQIYRLPFSSSPPQGQSILRRLSTGLGACTCSYLFPDNVTSIHASTFLATNLTDVSKTCPEKRCTSKESKTDPVLKKLCNTSYTWDLFPHYDIFKVNQFGHILKRLTDTFGYDAEGAISPDGSKIVFTSMRSGDPELWLMDSDGENLAPAKTSRILTNELGYDGGPFFSPDGTKISFRASRPRGSAEVAKYRQLLSYNLVEPLAMELFTINVDGSGLRQVTNLGGSNWAPFYLADNKRLIFSSNFNATGGHFGAFDLYMVNEDGSGLERVTFNEGGFDSFPMMDHRGKQLIWGSSRNGKGIMDLNLFLAKWKE